MVKEEERGIERQSSRKAVRAEAKRDYKLNPWSHTCMSPWSVSNHNSMSFSQCCVVEVTRSDNKNSVIKLARSLDCFHILT